MKITPSSILSLIIILLPLQPSYSQTSKAYKLLAKHQYEEAIPAFCKDTSKIEMEAPARYGLSKALSSKKETVKFTNLLEAGRQAILSDSLIRNASKELLKKWQQDWKLTPSNCTSLITSIQQEAWIDVKKSKSYSDLEQFRMRFPGFFTKPKPEVQAIRRKIVEGITPKAWETYDTISTLLQFHRDYLYGNDISSNKDYSELLWTAFLKDKGLQQLELFKREHPWHWLVRDCWLEACATAYQSGRLEPKIRFLEQYPESYMGWYVAKDLSENVYKVSKTEIEGLQLTERSRYKEVCETMAMIELLRNSKPVSDESLLDQIRGGGPSIRSWYLFLYAFNRYSRQRKWDMAEELLRSCIEIFPNISRECLIFRHNHQEYLKNALQIIQEKTDTLEPRRLEKVNTKGDETVPVVTHDNQWLYFTGRGRTDSFRQEDPFRVRILNDTLGTPELVSSLADSLNESLLSITSDGKTALVFINGALYLSTRKNDQIWNKPSKLPDQITKFPWIGKAVLSSDGQVLLMEAIEEAPNILQSPNRDIFCALRDEKGNWGTPFRLPDSVNTGYNERSPFLHTDGHTLYFSSDGHLGLGGMDIFMSRRKDDSWKNWTTPVNIGRQINTPVDDWGYSFTVMPDGKKAYFSAFESDVQQNDLFEVGLPANVRGDSMKTICLPIGIPGAGAIVIKNPEKKVLGRIKFESGERNVFVMLPDSTEQVIFDVESSQSLISNPVTAQINQIKPGACINDTLFAYSLTPGPGVDTIKFELPNIHFEYSKSDITPETGHELDRLFEKIAGKPIRLLIIGHTDDIGSEKAKLALSISRAEKTKDYLVGKGYPVSFLFTDGKGSLISKVPNTSDANRALNRRVEFFILPLK